MAYRMMGMIDTNLGPTICSSSSAPIAAGSFAPRAVTVGQQAYLLHAYDLRTIAFSRNGIRLPDVKDFASDHSVDRPCTHFSAKNEVQECASTGLDKPINNT